MQIMETPTNRQIN